MFGRTLSVLLSIGKSIGESLKSGGQAVVGSRSNEWVEITGFEVPLIFNILSTVGTGLGSGVRGYMYFGEIRPDNALWMSLNPDTYDQLCDEGRIKHYVAQKAV